MKWHGLNFGTALPIRSMLKISRIDGSFPFAKSVAFSPFVNMVNLF
jgi:hypothetical protein